MYENVTYRFFDRIFFHKQPNLKELIMTKFFQSFLKFTDLGQLIISYFGLSPFGLLFPDRGGKGDNQEGLEYCKSYFIIPFLCSKNTDKGDFITTVVSLVLYFSSFKSYLVSLLTSSGNTEQEFDKLSLFDFFRIRLSELAVVELASPAQTPT